MAPAWFPPCNVVLRYELVAPFGGTRKGSPWFSYGGRQTFGRVTPDGVLTEFPVPTPRSTPREITSDPDGNVWFTERLGNNMGRIAPDGVPFLVSRRLSARMPVLHLRSTCNGRIGRLGAVAIYRRRNMASSPTRPRAFPYS